jgi:PhnB protein
MVTSPIPPGYDQLLPYLAVRGAAEAIEFYKQLFGASEHVVMRHPVSGSILHAELKMRGALLMLGEESPGQGVVSPLALNGPSPVGLMWYVDDVDALWARAVAMGVKALVPPSDMFWGDRYAKFTDPFGHSWAIATHTQDLSPSEIKERAAAAFKQP